MRSLGRVGPLGKSYRGERYAPGACSGAESRAPAVDSGVSFRGMPCRAIRLGGQRASQLSCGSIPPTTKPPNIKPQQHWYNQTSHSVTPLPPLSLKQLQLLLCICPDAVGGPAERSYLVVSTTLPITTLSISHASITPILDFSSYWHGQASRRKAQSTTRSFVTRKQQEATVNRASHSSSSPLHHRQYDQEQAKRR